MDRITLRLPNGTEMVADSRELWGNAMDAPNPLVYRSRTSGNSLAGAQLAGSLPHGRRAVLALPASGGYLLLYSLAHREVLASAPKRNAMSVQYRAVGWNQQKRLYDAILAGSVALYLTLFVGIGALVHPNATAETPIIRGFGTAAILLLHVILGIGPLCRLNPRFLPLLYNRRHLGVTMFLLALVHGVFSIVQFHALGDRDPLVSAFVSNPRFGSFAQFPFQSLGVFALLILFVMAATSHDFG